MIIAAFLLSTSHFLALGILLAVLLLTFLPLVAIRAWRRFAGLERAAAIVDQKAELNGRLGTILALAEKEGDKPLWPFLVEDTVGRLDDFQPSRIEKHRISRVDLWFRRRLPDRRAGGTDDLLRAPQSGGAAQIPEELYLAGGPLRNRAFRQSLRGRRASRSDPETLRSLADRLEAANQNSRGGNRSAMNQLAHKAKDLASSLQDRLTGHQLRDTPEKVKIRLAEAMGDRPPENNDSGDASPIRRRTKAAIHRPTRGAGEVATASPTPMI